MSGNTSPKVKAAQAANRIERLRAKRDEELANAPASITERFAKQERRELEKLDPDVRAMAEKFLEE